MSAQINNKPAVSGIALTEGAMALIESVFNRTQISDPQKLLPLVCEELETRFPNNSLEYHLSQMHLETTSEVARSIACFFISKRF